LRGGAAGWLKPPAAFTTPACAAYPPLAQPAQAGFVLVARPVTGRALP